MIRIFLLTISGLLLAGCSGVEPANVNSLPANEIITLCNGVAELKVMPNGGRVIAYNLIGRDNVLYVGKTPGPKDLADAGEKWVNYGGARLWTLPEGHGRWDVMNRDWPPDETFDIFLWKILERSQLHVVMESQVSKYTGLKAIQIIRLDEKNAKVRIDYKLISFSGGKHKINIWPVTQVKLPEYIVMNRLADTEVKIFKRTILGPKNIAFANETSDIKFTWPPGRASKIGTKGEFISAVYPDVVFTQISEFNTDAKYVDGVNCEVYVDPDKKILEMEFFGRHLLLRQGESTALRVLWNLTMK